MALELRCRDAGCLACRGKIKADSKEELRAKAADHLKDAHGVDPVSETLLAYLVKVARRS